MTLAMCVKCGSIKFGALTHCRECGLRPETEVDIAYSFAFSDHYLSSDVLKTLSQQVLQGAPLPSLTKDQEQQFLAAARGYMQQFGPVLGLPPVGKVGP